MKAKLFLIAFFTSIAPLVYAQTEQLNQLDASGKKHGKWIVYLDEEWKRVDSANASYCRYTWYDHGVDIHPMGRGTKTLKTNPAGNAAENGKIKLLDGEYQWYDKKGRLKYVHVLHNGEYVSYKEYYLSGTLHTHFDYTRKCDGQPHSWAALIYDEAGNPVMTSYTCKDKDGKWPVMR